MLGFLARVAVTPHPLVLSALPSKVTMRESGKRPVLGLGQSRGGGSQGALPGPLGSGHGKNDRWGGKAEFRSYAGTRRVGGPELVTPLPSASMEQKGPPSRQVGRVDRGRQWGWTWAKPRPPGAHDGPSRVQMGLVRCPVAGPLQLGGQGRTQTAWRLPGHAPGQRRPGGSPPRSSVGSGRSCPPGSP